MSKLRVPAQSGLVSSEASVLGLKMAGFVFVCVQTSSSYRVTSRIALGPTQLSSFYFNNLLKDPTSEYSRILRYGGSGLQHLNLGGTQFSP